jgi:hypothetical protein
LKKLSGFRVYLDSERLEPGEAWKPALGEAQAASLITIVLFSERSKRSPYQKKEVKFAFSLAESGTHRVVPIFVSPLTPKSKGVPSPLRELQGLLFRDMKDLTRLADKLREWRAKVKARLSQLQLNRPEERSSPSPRSKKAVTVELTITGALWIQRRCKGYWTS